MDDVLQSSLPAPLWSPLWCDGFFKRLPGVSPLGVDEPWLLMDDAFGGQMRLRDQLIEARADDVLALEGSAVPAAQELLAEVLASISQAPGYEVTAKSVQRPDGVAVPINRDAPLTTAGRLVQEDLCIMEKQSDTHVLTGAVLCFPAGWTLTEKINRPLLAIHGPVASYDAAIAQRVQRLFDGIRVGAPLWRANGFFYDTAGLFAPFAEAAPRPKISDGAPYFRVERQCLRRLADTKAVVFSIHTFVVATQNLTPEQLREISAARSD